MAKLRVPIAGPAQSIPSKSCRHIQVVSTYHRHTQVVNTYHCHTQVVSTSYCHMQVVSACIYERNQYRGLMVPGSGLWVGA